MGSDGSFRGEITVAAWGSSKGEEWSYLAKSGNSRIIINHGKIINSIMFKSCRDNHLASCYSPKFGIDGRGDRTDIIKLDFPSEFLTGVSGSYSHINWLGNGNDNVCSLKIQTNRAEYRSFGGPGSSYSVTPFSFHAKDGVITGFHGREKQFLSAIGVYIMPVCSNSMEVVMNQHSGIASTELRRCLSPPPRSAGLWGSDGGREWDDGIFPALKWVELRVHVDTDVLTAVRFIYDKKDGRYCDCRGQISVAAWGSLTGKEWSFIAQSGICEIIVRHGEIIDSIKFKSSRDSDYSTRFGGKGGDRTDKIKLDYPSEFFTGVSGSYGGTRHGKNNIRGLKFWTNRSEYGPFGYGSGAPFSFHSKDGVITGFHGRAGRFLDAIGVYIVPVCSLSTEAEKNAGMDSSRMLSRCHSPPRSAAAFGGSGGRVWDDGVFSAVKGAHVRLLNQMLSAVRFIYENIDGSDFVSPFRGVSCTAEMQRKTMMFVEKCEFLIGIEGFYGPLEGKLGVNVIRSITFVSNKAKYGPFGAEIGTYFTSMNSGDCNRQVVGFHGRCGAYLDAIGLHTKYFS